MSTAYIGIDPGLTGAIALLSNVGEWVTDVPTYSKGDKRDYNFFEMYVLLAQSYRVHDCLIISLEQQQSMPGQGVSSTFKTGRGYGAWEALCRVVTPSYKIVSPRKWKKALGLTHDKEQSRALAAKLYPNLADQLKRKKDHNRAEAILLAHYTKEYRLE